VLLAVEFVGLHRSTRAKKTAWYPLIVPDDVNLVPIFPLPTVVLFPKLRVPLHIFEPRYRQMTEHAIEGDKRIGMVTVMPDHVAQMSGDPPIYEIGCVGIVRDAQRLPDGRYNFLLEGTHRFRVLDEPPRTGDRLFRMAAVEFIEEPEATDVSALRGQVIGQVDRVARLLGRSEGVAPDAFDALDDTTFTHSLANGFNFDAREKQGLLEENSVRERLERLSDLLEFAMAELHAGRTPNSGSIH
jgi:Lon protease-like protein